MHACRADGSRLQPQRGYIHTGPQPAATSTPATGSASLLIPAYLWRTLARQPPAAAGGGAADCCCLLVVARGNSPCQNPSVPTTVA
jgi:hypothetical protein